MKAPSRLSLLGMVFLLTACQTSQLTYLPSPRVAPSPETLFTSLNLDQDMIVQGRKGRWKHRPMEPRYITIHSTQNYSQGADAHRHALALKRGALRGRNSLGYLTWHFTVDESYVVQHLPTGERGEHADFDGPGNRYSIGIEMCENAGNHRGRTVDRTARLAASVAEAHDIPTSKIVPHYHWPRHRYTDSPHKNCPHFLLDNGKPGPTWKAFLARIDYYRAEIQKSPNAKNLTAKMAFQTFYRGEENPTFITNMQRYAARTASRSPGS